MYSECACLTESLAANVAREGLPLGVDVAVVAQVVLASEALVADLAWVGSFVGVRSLVDEQVVRLREVPTAEATHKLLARSENVTQDVAISFS